MSATWGQFQTSPAMKFLCRMQDESGHDQGVQDLTGIDPATLSLTIHPVGAAAFTGGGVFQIPSGTANQGICTYQPTRTDFATLGQTLLTVALTASGYNPCVPLLIVVEGV